MILACHAGDPGSNPGRRNFFIFSLRQLLRCKNEEAIGILVNGGENVLADHTIDFDFSKFYKESARIYDLVEYDSEHIDQKHQISKFDAVATDFFAQFQRPAVLRKAAYTTLFGETGCPEQGDNFIPITFMPSASRNGNYTSCTDPIFKQLVNDDAKVVISHQIATWNLQRSEAMTKDILKSWQLKACLESVNNEVWLYIDNNGSVHA